MQKTTSERLKEASDRTEEHEFYTGSPQGYRRGKTKTKQFTHHKYADKKHYHYQCVLASLAQKERDMIEAEEDGLSLITHYPYYAGLEELLKGREGKDGH